MTCDSRNIWLGAAILLGFNGAASVASAETIAYVSALTEDSIVRLRDLNQDGDYNDAGEATQFFGPGNASGFPGVGSAQAILVLGPDHVLAADGEESGVFETRVYRLRDLNGDGDAMDAGEATVFWDSMLPIGVNFDRPKEILFGPDGALYLADNNTINFDADTPEAVWRLEDLNADGDVNDPNEVSLYVELSPIGTAFGFISEDFKLNSSGQFVFSNAVSSTNEGTVFHIDPDRTVHEFASDADILGLALKPTGMTLDPLTENPIFSAVDIGENLRIVELVDLNQNGFIDDISEVVTRYRSDVSATGIAWDFNNSLDVDFDENGRLWLLDLANENILRFVDQNADGDFNDADEVVEVYSTALAGPAGGFVMTYPRTIGFACVGGLADLNLDGVVDLSDLSNLLAHYIQTDVTLRDGDITGDGSVNLDDLAALLAVYNTDCAP